MTPLIVKQLPMQDYADTWSAMQSFTINRDDKTPDELWLLEHHPVFTQGLAGKPEHLLNPNDIPVVQSDRGGQITYHGPGQLMAYTLFDLKRLGLNTRDFVIALEETVIRLLAALDITAAGKRDAPGVYVDSAKICSIGLRVKRHRAYHGLALNVAMDLSPFKGINPCGYENLEMTQIKDFNPDISLTTIKQNILRHIQSIFDYSVINQ